MKKHYLIAGLAAAAILATVACSTAPSGGTSWPSPQELTAGEAALGGVYAAACMSTGKCTPADNKAEADAIHAVSDFIAGPYTAAYNSGSITQALIDNEAQLLADVQKIITDVQGRKSKL